jgi:ATP-dependent RNA helicase SUPV3L1/SUV3
MSSGRTAASAADDRSESGGKSFAQSAPPPRREREPDPNSPFAKLAALKAQLEADAKERR